MTARTFYLETLGCPKNRVDGELILGQLSQRGWRYLDDPAHADLVVLNTCAFLASARQESVARYKALRALLKATGKIAITGCLAQKDPGVRQAVAGADYICGINDLADIARALEASPRRRTTATVPRPVAPASFLYDSGTPRLLSLSPYTAYVKIADGCSNGCSYCAIPGIRGSYRERTLADVLRECRNLVGAGVKELVVIAQDTTAFGRTHGATLQTLIEALDALTGDFRVRLMYFYPSRVSRQLLETMAHSRRVLPYLEVPLQHVSDKVLAAMHRPYTRGQIDQLLGEINRAFGDRAALRTTFITGFPAEGRTEFAELGRFIEQSGIFDYIGLFGYSREPQTAAWKLKAHPAKEIKRRVASLSRKAGRAMNHRLARFEGTTAEVLYEGIHPQQGLALGRAWFQAPEIDGRTALVNPAGAVPGQFVTGRLARRDGVDFFAE